MLLLAAVAAASGSGAGRAQALSETCAIAPADYGRDGEAPGAVLQAGLVDACHITRSLDERTAYGVTAFIRLYTSVDGAQKDFATSSASAFSASGAPLPDEQFQATSALGEVGAEARGNSPFGGLDGEYRFAFRRGCWAVSGLNTAIAQPSQKVVMDPAIPRTLALQLDQAIRAKPACPTSGPAGSTSPGALEAGLACDPGDLQATGDVVCTVAITNARADAQLVYEWTVDGLVQSGLSGNELDLRGLPAGSHQVSVRARDSKNALTAAPATASFVRGSVPAGRSSAGGIPTAPVLGAGAGTEASSSGTDRTGSVSAGGPRSAGLPPPVVVAGGALAVAAALSILLRSRRRHAREAAAPLARPSSVAEQATATAPPTRVRPPTISEQTSAASTPTSDRPSTLPEQPSRRDASRTPGPAAVSAPDPFGGLGQAMGGTLGAPVATSAPASRSRRPRKPKVEPEITVTLLVSPSIRTAGKVPDEDVDPNGRRRLWGDGVDYLYAGYQIDVTPGWKVAWDVMGGVQDTWWPEAPVVRRVQTPAEDDGQKVYVQVPWSDGPGRVSVRVDVAAAVRNEATQQLKYIHANAASGSILERQIEVIGAQPRLTLVASHTPAAADGSDIVRVEPYLELFGDFYPGGLQITAAAEQVRLTESLKAVKLDTYFQATRDQYLGPPADAPGVDVLKGPPNPPGNPADATRFRVSFGGAAPPDPGAAMQQGLTLRCNFHLKDDAIKQLGSGGLLVSYKVQPTGQGRGQNLVSTAVDDMAQEFYAACAARYAVTDIAPAEPDGSARIMLQPCWIDVQADPVALPKPLNAPSLLFETKLRATVKAAAVPNKPVSGDLICDDLGIRGADRPTYFFRYWSLSCHFEPPAQRQPFGIEVVDVDNNGQVLVHDDKQTPEPGNSLHAFEAFLYRHDEVCWNKDLYELTCAPTVRGQTYTISVVCKVDGEEQGRATIKIGEQVHSVSWSWDYSPFVLSQGKMEARPSYSKVTLPQFLAREPKYFMDTNPDGTPRLITRAALLQNPGYLPVGTVLIKGTDHSGIVTERDERTGALTIGHFLQGRTNRMRKPLNRDQIYKMEQEARDRKPGESERIIPVWRAGKQVGTRSGDAAVFFDSLEDFLGRQSLKPKDADLIQVWFPPMGASDLLPGSVA